MPKAKTSVSPEYGNESISQLQGPDRVRLRPGVIFGSDGLDGCEHAVFEILSNAIDEAREGYGNQITLTYYLDRSIEVEDFGRGCPLDWNPREQRWNWELVFCELYAGGKYNNNDEGGDYGFALGLNGLGSCATQYASRYRPAENRHGHPLAADLDVFTDIDIPTEYFDDCLRRQAVANAGVSFRLRLEKPGGGFETREYVYANSIVDYVKERAGEAPLPQPRLSRPSAKTVTAR